MLKQVLGIALAIPTGAPITDVNEAIEMAPLVAEKANEYLSK